MPASDPQGEQKFWFNGVPFRGVKSGNDTATLKFWFNGVPADYIFPPAASVSVTPFAFSRSAGVVRTTRMIGY